MVLVLSEEEVRIHLDLPSLVDAVGDALGKQAAEAVERPDRPHFPVGTGLNEDEPTGTAITMPAYIHGEEQYATKLVGVHEGNADRGYPTIHAQIALTDARTGRPEAYMAGTAITNARTGCLGALAVRELAPETTTLGVIGAGAQAHWQTRAIATVTELDDVRVYSPSDSRIECADDLTAEGIPARAVDTPGAAVAGADTVVTATTATAPVFPADTLDPGTLVVAVGAFTVEMQELDPAVLDGSTAVFADVPDEAAETGDLLASDLGVADLIPFGDLVSGRRSPPDGAATPVVVSVGSATLDAAAGAAVYRRAVEAGDGTTVPL
ncbi:ornithine cyclodeaminase family protein [Halorubrum ezzemoulense]|uniref:Ornithine cyclodeaminase family protein n=1 Tax=Halorubrum ezzemoulense TaxID=337243 RepID=A0ABT4Z6N2_HALEZ|nr:ornithine cyclodeaminase family protein [Halorubrum ezzemoulense]MDB2293828.1 ornithine cyclodeaminase family protein [Halorubrum ezzemoulense]